MDEHPAERNADELQRSIAERHKKAARGHGELSDEQLAAMDLRDLARAAKIPRTPGRPDVASSRDASDSQKQLLTAFTDDSSGADFRFDIDPDFKKRADAIMTDVLGRIDTIKATEASAALDVLCKACTPTFNQRGKARDFLSAKFGDWDDDDGRWQLMSWGELDKVLKPFKLRYYKKR